VSLGLLVLALFILIQNGAGQQSVGHHGADAGFMVRAAAGLAVAFIAVLNLSAALGKSAAPPKSGAPSLGSALLWLVFMLAAPATFTAARVERDLHRLDGLVEQARFGEAAALAHRVLALDSDAEFLEAPLSEIAARLDALVAQLEARVAVPLPAGASAGQRLDHAQNLAQLGHVQEALEISETIDDARGDEARGDEARGDEARGDDARGAAAANLRGTIHETQEAWDEGLAAYQEAKAHLDEQPRSPARDAALERALTGIAYCQRKQGEYAAAETAYQELLALAPTADSHFLLAQFYEDTQQTAPAQAHARRAMELNPQRYGRRGEQLIRKLAVFHFGCWSVHGSR
jgi:tetratricopeptide (TPR) repeat protein